MIPLDRWAVLCSMALFFLFQSLVAPDPNTSGQLPQQQQQYYLQPQQQSARPTSASVNPYPIAPVNPKPNNRQYSSNTYAPGYPPYYSKPQQTPRTVGPISTQALAYPPQPAPVTSTKYYSQKQQPAPTFTQQQRPVPAYYPHNPSQQYATPAPVKASFRPILPKLYYNILSPPSRVVLLVANILKIRLELIEIDIAKKQQMDPAFIQLNPQHTIPTYVEYNQYGRLVLYESRAICAFLISKYASNDPTFDILYPSNIYKRALVDQSLQFDLGILSIRIVDVYHTIPFPTNDDKKIQTLIEALHMFNDMLHRHYWAALDSHFTLADISLVVGIAQLESNGFDLMPYNYIQDWFVRCKNILREYGYHKIQKGSDALSAVVRKRLLDNANKVAPPSFSQKPYAP